MHSAIGKVNRLYGHMQERTGFAATDFNTYLKVREPQLLAKMNAVWKLIDCDIYYRFLDGRLQEKEFRNWRKHLSEWVDVLRSAIELYCLHRIDVVESDKVFVQSSTSV
ncbi:hypothetical protein JXO59_03980 [candidate division KSB1 bacterium]|nr:hypothetical protein [candidate division KSB1 bacterium]